MDETMTLLSSSLPLSANFLFSLQFVESKDIPCIDALVSALFLLAGDVEMDIRYRKAYERYDS